MFTVEFYLNSKDLSSQERLDFFRPLNHGNRIRPAEIIRRADVGDGLRGGFAVAVGGGGVVIFCCAPGPWARPLMKTVLPAPSGPVKAKTSPPRSLAASFLPRLKVCLAEVVVILAAIDIIKFFC